MGSVAVAGFWEGWQWSGQTIMMMTPRALLVLFYIV
jgi:hypothetical protein